uniref:Uncharacterized protein n=1 Tax=Cajanus cajan TaxID=3821 RepID=A0A151T6C3_CAJCA|nr:hypothetical protein KK1_017134 [Cajanus cajan]
MFKIDKLSTIHYRGKFARICVEVNLGRKLLSEINFMGKILNLEYEGLHSIYFNCRNMVIGRVNMVSSL